MSRPLLRWVPPAGTSEPLAALVALDRVVRLLVERRERRLNGLRLCRGTAHGEARLARHLQQLLDDATQLLVVG